MGVSRSGASAAEFLLKRGARVYLYDEIVGDRIEQTMQDLQSLGARRIEKEKLGEACEVCDALVLSPGVPIDHPLAIAFKRNGKAVVGETELAARYMRCPIVAITGTNGKTTTVTMLTEVLKKGGYSAQACGNIGAPMIGFCDMGENEIAVAEISSFQLETLNSIRPHVSVVLNVTEDHLNRHYNMENYVFLKSKLLKNCTGAEYAVLNYDDETVRNFAGKTKAQTLFFSVRERVKGAFYENGDLFFGKERIMSADELPTGGLHNVQNALATIAVAKILGVKTKDIVSALCDFKGVKHRIETVAEIDGVLYVDDSKGTNVDATLKAIASMKRETVLLLGGKHKGYDYNALFSVLEESKVAHAVLYGENRFALFKAARENRYHKITLCDDFEFAVKVAALKAQPGQTVLLSPASASFDQFANYEERGDKFVEIIRSFEAVKQQEEKCLEECEEECFDSVKSDGELDDMELIEDAERTEEGEE